MRYLVLATLAISAWLTGTPAGALDSLELYPKGASPKWLETADESKAPDEAKDKVDPSIFDAWRAEVRTIVRENMNFPLIARLQHDATSAGIGLTVDRSGRIEAATVAKSSGNEDVDEVTRQMFERMTFPPLPAAYPYQKLKFVYTINYKFY